MWIALWVSKLTSLKWGRSSNLLEIIHTNIYWPYMDASSPEYFITFINDYFWYMYPYLLHSKNETLNACKGFNVEVEKQCGKKLRNWGQIEVESTMVGTLKVNKRLVHLGNFFKILGLFPCTLCLVLYIRMVERRNWTLMDMWEVWGVMQNFLGS